VRVTRRPAARRAGRGRPLDDISELVTAQRSAGLGPDVARRIAHEIKNPLTPDPALRRTPQARYGKHIVEGKDVFDQCTDTIIRQVDDIKRMVDEFSSFAACRRRARPRTTWSDCVRQALFLMRVGRSRHRIRDDLPAEPVIADSTAG